MTPIEYGLLVGLSAWAAIDGAAFGQFLVSRPLVTGVLTGVVLGDPVTGGLVGGTLELLFLSRFPVGAVRVPEPGPAAIPATALAVVWSGFGGASEAGGAPIAAALLVGVAAAWIGGRTVTMQRVLNGRLVERARERGPEAARLGGALRTALLIDALRGALLGGIWLGLLALAGNPSGGGVRYLLDAWPLARGETLALGGVAAMLALGQVVRVASGSTGSSAGSDRRSGGSTRASVLVGAGIACGAAVVLLTTLAAGAGP